MIANKNFDAKKPEDALTCVVLDSELVNDLRDALKKGNPQFVTDHKSCEIYTALTVSIVLALTLEGTLTADNLVRHIHDFSDKMRIGNYMPVEVQTFYVNCLMEQGILMLNTSATEAKFSLTPTFAGKMNILRDNVSKVLEKILTDEEKQDKNPL